MNIDLLFNYALCFFAAVVLGVMTAGGVAAYLNSLARKREP